MNGANGGASGGARPEAASERSSARSREPFVFGDVRVGAFRCDGCLATGADAARRDGCFTMGATGFVHEDSPLSWW